jgi:hypothetical protein
VPKKVASVINVEPKVWFANERTWLAYLSIAVLLGSLSGTLFAGSGSEAHAGREKVIKAFGSTYGILYVPLYLSLDARRSSAPCSFSRRAAHRVVRRADRHLPFTSPAPSSSPSTAMPSSRSV